MHIHMINLAIRQGCLNNVYPCAEFHKFNCGNLATTLQSFSKVDTTYKFYGLCLNQVRVGHRPVRSWFVKIVSVQASVCVCACACLPACVCIHPRGY